MSKLTIHVVLDRSGSMISCKADAIGGFNSYVENIAKESPTSVLSLTLFDTLGIDTIQDKVNIKKVVPLDDKSYQPRGGTPLYDAIGKAVTDLSEQKGKSKVLVILTDGEENASQEHNKASIKTLLEEKQKEGWLITYLAANQDAMAEGAKFGINTNNAMSFDPQNIGATLRAASASTLRYASDGLAAATYTMEEREAAKK